MDDIKIVSNIDITNILNHLYSSNIYVFDYIKQRNRNFKYIFENTCNCLVYCVKESFFNSIVADKNGLREYIQNKNNDNLDITGERFSALNAEMIGNFAICTQNGLNYKESITFNGTPYSLYSNGFNQSDTGHLNMTMGIKCSNLFTDRTFVIETLYGLDDELLICKCSFKELYQYIPDFYDVFDEYRGYDYFYIILGVLLKEDQEKYLRPISSGLKGHKSKKEITCDCFDSIVPLEFYDFSRVCSIIHNVNLVSNLKARNELCMLLLGILKINNMIDIPISNNDCLKYILKWNNLKILICKDSKKSNIMTFDMYQLVNNRVQKIKELVFDPNKICSEDFIFDNNLNNCILIGMGLRSLLEILQKNCENKNIDIQKTCLFLDESDIADIINPTLSMRIKSSVLKEVHKRNLNIDLNSVLILNNVVCDFMGQESNNLDSHLNYFFNLLELWNKQRVGFIYKFMLSILIGLFIIDLKDLDVNFRFPPYIKDMYGFIEYNEKLSDSIKKGRIFNINFLIGSVIQKNKSFDILEEDLKDWCLEINKLNE